MPGFVYCIVPGLVSKWHGLVAALDRGSGSAEAVGNPLYEGDDGGFLIF